MDQASSSEAAADANGAERRPGKPDREALDGLVGELDVRFADGSEYRARMTAAAGFAIERKLGPAMNVARRLVHETGLTEIAIVLHETIAATHEERDAAPSLEEIGEKVLETGLSECLHFADRLVFYLVNGSAAPRRPRRRARRK